MTAPPTALVCREIRLREFRNFAALELSFPPDGVAIIGDNGSGKTNLLEALHYLEIFRSFRGAADEQLARFGSDAFHVRGCFEDRATGRTVEISAGYERRMRRKKVVVDGAECERLGDGIGRIGTVIFSPSDVGIVGGAPGERRRFMDIVLSLNSRGYLDALQQYRHILRQRNALLRDGRGGLALEPWDAGLVESGARVIAARRQWVRAHAARFAVLYRAIGGGAEARLEYHSDVPLDDDEPWLQRAGRLRRLHCVRMIRRVRRWLRTHREQQRPRSRPRSRRGSAAWRSGSGSAASRWPDRTATICCCS
jgi:DNA replication and repair protein RecF